MITKKSTSPSVKELRLRLKLSQTDFWNQLGVTQSSGSRYENGRALPKPTRSLLDLRFGKTPLKALAELRGTTVAALIEGGK